MLMLDLAIKSPCEEYRERLRDAVRKSPRTQEQIALDAGLAPSNLSNLLAGRREPLLDPTKNMALARACGVSYSLTNTLQFSAEACHGLKRQPRDFRRYMALAVRTWEVLIEKMMTEIEALQDMYTHGDIPKPIFIPQSLLAAKKVVNSLRYCWPVETGERWDDYKVISDWFLKRLAKLPPDEQLERVIELEVEEALEWVRDYGDLDPEMETRELIRRLSIALGVDEEGLGQIVYGVRDLASRHVVRSAPTSRGVEVFSLEEPQ